jgi:endogenous inhibitor of DNA gyrase (YacG/DUF329 family)
MGLFSRKKQRTETEEKKWTKNSNGLLVCPECKKTVEIDTESYTTLLLSQHMPNTRVLCPFCSTNSRVDLS